MIKILSAIIQQYMGVLSIVVTLVFAVGNIFLFQVPLAQAAVGINRTIDFQGKIVNANGTNVTNGNYNIEFTIYTVSTGGTALWTETRTSGDQITVTDGIFHVALGEVTALASLVDFNSDTLYLGVNFNGDGEMTPRIRLTAVPYAFNAEKVGGLTVTNTTGTLTIPDATTIAFSGANDLTFTTTGATTVTLPTTGTLATLAGTETFTDKTIGSTGLTFSGATTDITTGTNEHFAIMPNGTGNVGIGTTSPSYLLDLRRDQDALSGFRVHNNSNNSLSSSAFGISNSNRGGAVILFADNYTAGGLLPHFAGRLSFLGDVTSPPLGLDIVSPHGSGDVRFYTGGYGTADESLRIDATGNVGIGTTTISELLHVDGNIRADGSVLGESIDRTTAGALTIGDTTATSISICNSAACDTINIGTNADADTINIGDSLDGLTIASSAFNVNSSGAISGVTTFASSGDWSWSAVTPTLTITSGETLTFTDGTDSFVINTAGSSFSFSDGTNGFTFDADTGPTYTGTARPTRQLVFSPEYSGGTLSTFYGAGTDSAITGGMTADIETTATDDQRTYYEWDSTEGTLQSYTVVLRITLPQDFSAWNATNALQVSYTTESTSTANNALDAYVYLSSNSTTAVASDTNNAAAVAETWETITIDDSVLDDASAPEWDAAGETAVIYLRMRSTGGNFVRLGDVTLNYMAQN